MDRRDLPHPTRLFWFGLGFELSLIGVAALLGLWFHGEAFPFDASLDLEIVGISLLACVPMVAMALFLSSEAGLSFPPFRRISNLLSRMLGPLVREMPLWKLCLLALAAGIGEEVLFRGVIQTAFGMLATSIVFALLHALTLTYAMLTFVISIYFGWIFDDTSQNVVVPALVHTLYDVFALLLLRRACRKDPLDESALAALEPQANGASESPEELTKPRPDGDLAERETDETEDGSGSQQPPA